MDAIMDAFVVRSQGWRMPSWDEYGGICGTNHNVLCFFLHVCIHLLTFRVSACTSSSPPSVSLHPALAGLARCQSSTVLPRCRSV